MVILRQASVPDRRVDFLGKYYDYQWSDDIKKTTHKLSILFQTELSLLPPKVRVSTKNRSLSANKTNMTNEH